jgi:hypothetical protein
MATRTRNPDIVRIIEAAYAIDAPQVDWLRGIVEAARPLVDAGLGACAYAYDLTVRPARANTYVNLDSPIDAQALAGSLGTATDDYIERSWKRVTAGTASEVPGYHEQPGVKLYFHPQGVRDVLAINAYDPSGVGVWVGALLPRERRLRALERATLARASAHIAAAFRLRRRVAVAEAVLSPSGKVLHAEGDAELREARDALREAALAMERARGKLRHSARRGAPLVARADGRALEYDRHVRVGRKALPRRAHERTHTAWSGDAHRA